MRMISTFLDLTIRVGCHLTYEATVPTPVVFMLRPRLDDQLAGQDIGSLDVVIALNNSRHDVPRDEREPHI